MLTKNQLIINQFIQEVKLGQYQNNNVIFEQNDITFDYSEVESLVMRYTHGDCLQAAAVIAYLNPDLKFCTVHVGEIELHYCVCIPVEGQDEPLYFDLNGLHTLDGLKSYWRLLASVNRLNNLAHDVEVKALNHPKEFFQNLFNECCDCTTDEAAQYFDDVTEDVAMAISLAKNLSLFECKFDYFVNWIHPKTLTSDPDLSEDGVICYNDNISVKIVTKSHAFETSRRFVIISKDGKITAQPEQNWNWNEHADLDDFDADLLDKILTQNPTILEIPEYFLDSLKPHSLSI